MKIGSTFRVSLHVLARQKLLLLVSLSIAVSILSAALAAQFGGRQPATVALDIGLSALRIVLPLFLVFQVQELFSREFERKFYQISLTYPISRVDWLLGRFAALLFLVIALLLILASVLAVQVYFAGQAYAQATPVSLGMPFWITVGFVSLDLLVLLSIACFWAVIASTPSFVLIGTLGFMLIARSYSAILALLAADTGVVGNADVYHTNIGLLGFLLPDLGALDVRMVALYGRMEFLPPDWAVLVSGSVAYALALLLLTIWLFGRKQFA